MSLILEALKKSEQQRRLGEAPTLGSPVVSTRKRRNLLPLIAILIVVAGGVWWWLGHRTDTPAPATPAPVASTAPAETPISQQVQKRPPAGTARTAPQRTPPVANAAQEKRAAIGVGNAAPATPPAAAPSKPPVATAGAAAAPDKNAGLPAPATPAPAPAPAKTDAAVPAATPATTAAATPAATNPPPAAVAPTKPSAPADTTAAVTKPAPAAAGEALPTVWELPYATRKDIPAIELSMHVFSSDPKQRFVVIKGDRHAEGDEVGTDLVLKEIRQDGIVLDYKGQVFFYPRSGR
jgi:general secretion pathway protein B